MYTDSQEGQAPNPPVTDSAEESEPPQLYLGVVNYLGDWAALIS